MVEFHGNVRERMLRQIILETTTRYHTQAVTAYLDFDLFYSLSANYLSP